ncbi:hypothetical protein PCE1_001696 [Barthelona sp. PCE]
MSERTKPVSRSVRAGVSLSVGRIHRYLKQGKYADRIGAGAPVYLAAVLDYLIAEVLDAAGTITMEKNRQRITPRHLLLGMKSDTELAQLISNVTFPSAGVVPFIHPELLPKKGTRRTRSAKGKGKAAAKAKGVAAKGKGKAKGKAKASQAY